MTSPFRMENGYAQDDLIGKKPNCATDSKELALTKGRASG